MGTLGQDVRYGIRRMKRSPGFTAAAVATLALGLGLNSAVSSLAHALFLKGLPLDESERLALVDQTLAGRPAQLTYSLSYPDYLYYREHAKRFADLAAHYPTSPMHVATSESTFEVLGSVVTANYFSVLRLQPVLGRFFVAEEDRIPLLAHLLYGVSPRDPFALLAGPAALTVVALMAIWLPARRAMAVDPMVALRVE